MNMSKKERAERRDLIKGLLLLMLLSGTVGVFLWWNFAAPALSAILP